MHNSKPIELLKILSKTDLKKFTKFLQSPYFNCKPGAERLLDRILPFFPAFDSPYLEREKVFEKLYPGKPYNDVLMRKLISDLGKYLQEFIIVEKRLSPTMNRSMIFLDVLVEKKINKDFEKQISNIKKELSENGVLYNDYLKDYTSLYRLGYNHYNDANDFEKCNTNLQLFGDYNVALFLQNLVSIYKSRSQMSSSYNPDNKPGIFDHFFSNFDYEKFIKDSADSEVLEDYDFLKENYLIYRINQNIDEFKSYNDLKEMAFESFPKFDFAYGTRVINALLNFGLSRIIHRKDSSYYKELFHLYKLFLDNDNLLSFHNNFMNLVTYRNVLVISMHVKEFEWTEKFITEFLPRVNDENRQTLSHVSFAMLYFEQKKFADSLNELNNVKFDHAIFKL